MPLLVLVFSTFAFGMDKEQKQSKKELRVIATEEKARSRIEKLFPQDYTSPTFLADLDVFFNKVDLRTLRSDLKGADTIFCSLLFHQGQGELKAKAQDRFDKQEELYQLIVAKDISKIDSEFSQLLSTGATLDFTYGCSVSPEQPCLLMVQVLYFKDNNSLKKIEYLQSKGADVKCVGHTGSTLLMLAMSSAKDTCDLIRYLLKQGVDINKKNNDGCTALGTGMNYARACIEANLVKKLEICLKRVDLLLKKGAVISLKDKYGRCFFDDLAECIKFDASGDGNFIKYASEYPNLKIFL